MKIIKLSAIDSTNSFLKKLAKNAMLENFTIVSADEQTAGKGQIGSKWHSEKGKNLTLSILIKHSDLFINSQNYFNFAISLAVFDSINALKIADLKIKWPNDILSANKKISGILIENSYQKNKMISSVVGIGINANQTSFPANLKRVSSIKKCIGKDVHLEDLIKSLQKNIINYTALFQQKEFKLLEEKYLINLYKKEIPSTFIDAHKKYFMGIIKGVSNNGKLQVLLEDDSIKEFGIKEISFA